MPNCIQNATWSIRITLHLLTQFAIFLVTVIKSAMIYAKFSKLFSNVPHHFDWCSLVVIANDNTRVNFIALRNLSKALQQGAFAYTTFACYRENHVIRNFSIEIFLKN